MGMDAPQRVSSAHNDCLFALAVPQATACVSPSHRGYHNGLTQTASRGQVGTADGAVAGVVAGAATDKSGSQPLRESQLPPLRGRPSPLCPTTSTAITSWVGTSNECTPPDVDRILDHRRACFARPWSSAATWNTTAGAGRFAGADAAVRGWLQQRWSYRVLPRAFRRVIARG